MNAEGHYRRAENLLERAQAAETPEGTLALAAAAQAHATLAAIGTPLSWQTPEYSVQYQTVKACTATYLDGSRTYTCNLDEGHQSYGPHGDGRGVHWNDLGENSTPHANEEVRS